MPSDGNVFQLKSHPKVTPAAPNRADGPSCHHGRRLHGTVDRSGCFTGCTLSVLNNCTRFLCFKTEPNSISVQLPKNNFVKFSSIFLVCGRLQMEARHRMYATVHQRYNMGQIILCVLQRIITTILNVFLFWSFWQLVHSQNVSQLFAVSLVNTVLSLLVEEAVSKVELS